jgi:hypothetical protein
LAINDLASLEKIPSCFVGLIGPATFSIKFFLAAREIHWGRRTSGQYIDADIVANAGAI